MNASLNNMSCIIESDTKSTPKFAKKYALANCIAMKKLIPFLCSLVFNNITIESTKLIIVTRNTKYDSHV